MHDACSSSRAQFASRRELQRRVQEQRKREAAKMLHKIKDMVRSRFKCMHFSVRHAAQCTAGRTRQGQSSRRCHQGGVGHVLQQDSYLWYQAADAETMTRMLLKETVRIRTALALSHLRAPGGQRRAAAVLPADLWSQVRQGIRVHRPAPVTARRPS